MFPPSLPVVPGRVLVVGQLARELVLHVDEMPAPGTTADVRERREGLGGQGADQAGALARLGAAVALVAVVGGDDTGDRLLDRATRDGIDVSGVIRRDECPTALVVAARDGAGQWRHLRDVPPACRLTADDVADTAGMFTGAAAVLVQVEQPPPAALAAARLARAAGALVVLDGVPAAEDRAELLALADVIRADGPEAGVSPDDPGAVRSAAAKMLAEGPALVVLGLPGGTLFVWDGGDLLLPAPRPAEALTAALTLALVRGDDPATAARYASR